jgi:hypothetical protein
MKTYLVWGEYGPVAYMTIEYKVQAESRDAARAEGIRLLKETDYWDRIGERNVYVMDPLDP